MANTFTITISAVDKASATVRKVNDSVSRMTRPFEEVGKSFKSLGRELGFERIGKNLTNIGREAGGAARSISNIVAPRSKRCPSRISWPHLPPGAEFFSKTETVYPFFARYTAVAIPPIPAPIITADFFEVIFDDSF